MFDEVKNQLKHIPLYTIIVLAAIITTLNYKNVLSFKIIEENPIIIPVVDFFAIVSTFLLGLSEKQDKNFSKFIKDLEEKNSIEKIMSVIDPAKSVLFTENVKDSEFDFFNMVKRSKKSIFLVGPTLSFLTTEDNREEVKDILFRKLRKHPEFEIRLMILDNRNKSICNFMKEFVFEPTFLDDLDVSSQVFKDWSKEAEIENLKLTICVTESITFSLFFVDEQSSEGLVLITPIPWQSNSRARACFLIEKKHHPHVFENYLSAYINLFNSEKKGKNIGLLET